MSQERRRASLTLDTYSHVILDEPTEALAALRRSVLALYGGADDDWRGSPGGYPEAGVRGENPMDTGV
jgi:hypothetical protein